MFEIPEFTTLAKQINQTLRGKVIQQGSLGNTPHKFVWYNRSPADFEHLTQGKPSAKPVHAANGCSFLWNRAISCCLASAAAKYYIMHQGL